MEYSTLIINSIGPNPNFSTLARICESFEDPNQRQELIDAFVATMSDLTSTQALKCVELFALLLAASSQVHIDSEAVANIVESLDNCEIVDSSAVKHLKSLLHRVSASPIRPRPTPRCSSGLIETVSQKSRSVSSLPLSSYPLASKSLRGGFSQTETDPKDSTCNCQFRKLAFPITVHLPAQTSSHDGEHLFDTFLSSVLLDTQLCQWTRDMLQWLRFAPQLITRFCLYILLNGNEIAYRNLFRVFNALVSHIGSAQHTHLPLLLLKRSLFFWRALISIKRIHLDREMATLIGLLYTDIFEMNPSICISSLLSLSELKEFLPVLDSIPFKAANAVALCYIAKTDEVSHSDAIFILSGCTSTLALEAALAALTNGYVDSEDAIQMLQLLRVHLPKLKCWIQHSSDFSEFVLTHILSGSKYAFQNRDVAAQFLIRSLEDIRHQYRCNNVAEAVLEGSSPATAFIESLQTGDFSNIRGAISAAFIGPLQLIPAEDLLILLNNTHIPKWILTIDAQLLIDSYHICVDSFCSHCASILFQCIEYVLLSLQCPLEAHRFLPSLCANVMNISGPGRMIDKLAPLIAPGIMSRAMEKYIQSSIANGDSVNGSLFDREFQSLL